MGWRGMGWAIAAAVLTTWSAAGAAETPIVTLTVEEENGVDRVNEPMTMGVPLPEGKVVNASSLYLRDAEGKPIRAQVTKVAQWLDGKSVKWVHLTWNQSLAAKGKTTLALFLGDDPDTTFQTRLTAVESDGAVTVQTGYVKFVVRGSKFNGIEAAWFDPTGQNAFDEASRVIGGEGGGSVTLAAPPAAVTVADEKFVVPADAVKTYASANDADGKVVIEEQGPRRVVLKATGRHLGADRKVLDYIVRFYAYAESPVVRVSHTFVGAHGTKPTDVEFLSGLYLDVPTTLGGGKVTVGTDGEPAAIDGPAAQVLQDSSDHFAVKAGTALVTEGKGKSTKPNSTGWIDLTKGERGLAVGVKWFWQMFPKSLSADAKGLLRVGLFPRETAEPLEVYMGQSRTHYLTFVFHDGKTAARDLNNLFSGQSRPLRAWAAPTYYCRDTHAFGYSVEADPAQFLPEDAAKARKHDAVLLESIKQLLPKVDSRNRNGATMESYGIYAWGDLYHWTWGANWGQSPYHQARWRYSWEGNYYDHPHAMFMQFVRTGDKTYLERYWPNAVQIGDVHTCNYHPNPALIGACRYCPPRNFVAQDEGNVYVSAEYNHFKTQSVFAHWYLTGDRRSYEHCQMQANNALTNREADSGWADRGVGAQLAGLWNAYELWREPRYLARMKEMANRAMAQFRNQGRFEKGGFTGIGCEGLCYYYWVSGDPAVIEAFKSGFARRKPIQSHMVLCYAMMYRVTGEEEYKQLAWRCIANEAPTFGVHEGGQLFRNTHFALFFLSEAGKGWRPVQSGG
jgi:hypothetical protein